jgi:hypothetical protein
MRIKIERIRILYSFHQIPVLWTNESGTCEEEEKTRI